MNLDHLPRRELERLSAYLDGELRADETRKLELQLQRDPSLRDALRQLQVISQSMRALPQVKPPRSFTLSPDSVGLPQRKASYPILRFATALAAFALVALVGIDVITGNLIGAMPSRALQEAVAQAPAAEELGLADAAKSEVGEMDEAPAEAPMDEMAAAAEMPVEEEAGEGLAMAEPAAEQEDAVQAERNAEEPEEPGEPPAPAELPPQPEPQLVETQVSEEEPLLGYSAPTLPQPDALANQVEHDEPIAVEPDQQPVARPSSPRLWIRGIEIGLAVLTLVLGALTLWARKRS